MAEHPIDFTPLDPTAERSGFDIRARAITAAAMAARSRSAARSVPVRRDILSDLASMTWPVLAAAALVVAVSLPALVTLHVSAPAAAAAEQVSGAQALGIPARITALTHADTTPTLSEIVAALGPPNGGGPRVR